MTNLINKLKDKVAHSGSEPALADHATSTIELLDKPIGPIGYGLMGGYI